MGRKNLSFSGPLTKQAVKHSLARFYRVEGRLKPAELDALSHFHVGGPRETTATGTQLLRDHGITEEQELKIFGGPSNFFQHVNCRSGVIRR